MENTKTIALIAFTAIQLASGAISAQQLTNSSTKAQLKQEMMKESSRLSSRDDKREGLKAAMKEDMSAAMKSKGNGASDKKSRKDSAHPLKERSRSGSENEKMSVGGADAGGAIAIRQNGKLLTLTEAGFIFTKSANEAVVEAKKYPTYYSISQQTKEELRQILQTLPLVQNMSQSYKQAVTASVLNSSDRSTFIDARNAVQPAVYEKIKKDYQNLLKLASKKIQLNRENSALPAYSDESKTYILSAFEEYSPHQQALTLIHEYMMRTPLPVSQKLLAINQVDNLIQAYLNSDQSEESAITYTKAMSKINSTLNEESLKLNSRAPDVSLQGKISLLFDFELVPSYTRKKREAALRTLERQMGRPLLASELFLKPVELTRGYSGMDMSLVQKFDSILPATTLFSDANFLLKFFGSFPGEGSYVENLTLTLQLFANEESFDSYQKYKNIAFQLSAEFDILCQKNYTEVVKSEVNGDGLVHTSTVDSQIYFIRCQQVQQGIRGYGAKLEIQK